MLRRFQGTSLAVLAAVPLLLVVVATADATTMSYTASVPLTATDWATSLSFPQFNPSLGTLNSVTLSLDGHIGGTRELKTSTRPSLQR